MAKKKRKKGPSRKRQSGPKTLKAALAMITKLQKRIVRMEDESEVFEEEEYRRGLTDGRGY